MGRTQQASVDGSVSKKFNLNRGERGPTTHLCGRYGTMCRLIPLKKNSKAAAVIKNNRNVRA